jgi:hypothetical protein
MTWDGFWFGVSIAAGVFAFAIAIRVIVFVAGFVWGIWRIAQTAWAQKARLDRFEAARRKARDG